MGKQTPTEAAPAYEDLFHERGASSRNGYSMVEQIDTNDAPMPMDVEPGHRHHSAPVEITPTEIDQPDQHIHCAECDRQRERRERRESSQKSCGMVAKTFILIALFMMILGIVIVQAWKDVRLKKNHD